MSILFQMLALDPRGPGVHQSMMAESAMGSMGMSAVIYILLIGFLVSILLIGGFIVINLGLMSKRDEDHIGGRTPSDVGLLKGNVWPEEPGWKHTLPAEEDEPHSA